MYCKLSILLALAGCLSVLSQTTTSITANATTNESASTTSTESTNTGTNESANTASSESASTTTTDSANTSTTTTSTTTAAATTAATTTATTGSPSTTSTATVSQSTPRTRPGLHRPSRPGPRPGSRPGSRPNQLPRLPIISDIAEAIINISQPRPPRNGNGGRPGGGGRRPRSLDFLISLNASNIFDFLSGQSLPGFPGIPDLSNFEFPDLEELVPVIPEIFDIECLQFPEVQNFPRLPPVLGLQSAVSVARETIAGKLGAGQTLTGGIQKAIEIGICGSDPTTAIRILISTVLNAYWECAVSCPVLIVGGFVLREGLWLAADILRVIADITLQIADCNA